MLFVANSPHSFLVEGFSSNEMHREADGDCDKLKQTAS